MGKKSENKLEKLLQKHNIADERTVQMLVSGVDCIGRLVDDKLTILGLEQAGELRAPMCASQKVHGPINACAMICGEEDALRKLAEAYVGEAFIESTEDALDALCELINVTNGEFARSFTEEAEDLEPPFFRQGPSIIRAESIIMLNIQVCSVTALFCIAWGAGIAAE